MKVKQKLIELKEQKDRLIGAKKRLETVRKNLRDELEEINTRILSMDSERAARMAAFIDGSAGA